MYMEGGGGGVGGLLKTMDTVWGSWIRVWTWTWGGDHGYGCGHGHGVGIMDTGCGHGHTINCFSISICIRLSVH